MQLGVKVQQTNNKRLQIYCLFKKKVCRCAAMKGQLIPYTKTLYKQIISRPHSINAVWIDSIIVTILLSLEIYSMLYRC
jgi:hypothetical protein